MHSTPKTCLSRLKPNQRFADCDPFTIGKHTMTGSKTEVLSAQPAASEPVGATALMCERALQGSMESGGKKVVKRRNASAQS